MKQKSSNWTNADFKPSDAEQSIRADERRRVLEAIKELKRYSTVEGAGMDAHLEGCVLIRDIVALLGEPGKG